jgi:hypothetical protein
MLSLDGEVCCDVNIEKLCPVFPLTDGHTPTPGFGNMNFRSNGCSDLVGSADIGCQATLGGIV